ncbi:hypothetical protein IHQ68_04455 [Chelatococcus sambhunathii]|uniref:Uncharacterized protein n=1 Tax=Chelatococcus sambhunathii TaxID=363953 RepID=A0ABU1DCN5_9HYPH|nr:hypothetical protein [Chelatococcus sambhunathii]MDR4305877.1 hypothetical protein [Chelatococcus sambhunathii]
MPLIPDENSPFKEGGELTMLTGDEMHEAMRRGLKQAFDDPATYGHELFFGPRAAATQLWRDRERADRRSARREMTKGRPPARRRS